MAAVPERFDQLLQEKLDELDVAAAQETMLLFDEVEQLRLQAAALVTRGESRPWSTGAHAQYQPDQMAPDAPSPTLDIRFPARPEVADGTAPVHGPSSKRQGRRVP